MPVDPEAQALLDMIAATSVPALSTLSVEDARNMMDWPIFCQ